MTTTTLPTTENGCTGLCCAAFRVPHTMGELRAMQAGRRPSRVQLAEVDQLIDMLIPLTPKQASERHVQFGGVDRRRFRWSDRGHQFTCRHWDEETRLCGIYEDRPDMCRNFPYGKSCPFGCSCEAG